MSCTTDLMSIVWLPHFQYFGRNTNLKWALVIKRTGRILNVIVDVTHEVQCKVQLKVSIIWSAVIQVFHYQRNFFNISFVIKTLNWVELNWKNEYTFNVLRCSYKWIEKSKSICRTDPSTNNYIDIDTQQRCVG